MLQHRSFITVLVIGCYILAKHVVPGSFTPSSFWWQLFTQRILPLVLIILALWLLHQGKRNIMEAWGVRYGFGQGLRMAFLFTLPMLIGYGILNQFELDLDPSKLIYGILLAPIFEELLYRGFLFGQLYRYGGWGFIPAGLLNALIFGSLHLYQAQDFGSAVAVFAVTAIGGLWFAWLYVEWNYNLWIAIFLHLFMNAWWLLFDMSDNAAGGLYANIFRGLTIALSIVFTLRMKKRQGGLEITKDKLWVNKPAVNML